jgi:hypothetical protein
MFFIPFTLWMTWEGIFYRVVPTGHGQKIIGLIAAFPSALSHS